MRTRFNFQNYGEAVAYEEMLFESSTELADYKKYCYACGRGILPGEQKCYAVSVRDKKNKTMRLICPDCKADGVGF